MSDFLLTALDGSNPLALLTALGTLRIGTLLWPSDRLQIRWIKERGWRPELIGAPVDTAGQLCVALHDAKCWAPMDSFAELGSNLTVAAATFAPVAAQGALNSRLSDRRAGDFSCAFACEVIDDPKKDRVEYTDLCFITGSGHQNFLGSARALAECCQPKHLHEALFGPWRNADKGHSFRWDPDDAKEYALMFQNPGPLGVQSVWGANRLAFEALPLFPVVPNRRGLLTTGFERMNRKDEFTWPIWTQPAGLDVCRGLLGLPDLQEPLPDRAVLGARGIAEIFRAQRVRIGQGANFKVSFRPARSV